MIAVWLPRRLRGGEGYRAAAALALVAHLAAAAGPRVWGEGLTIAFLGDVMTGRGIDQILAHPGDPSVREPFARDAREYVRLAESLSGPIPRGVPPEYIWGDALAALQGFAPQVRIANLETAVTARGEPWPGKGIQYRMNPENVNVLTAARLDVCVLANNHALDWGHLGLADTLEALRRSGIATAGAGASAREAEAPAVLPVRGGGRVLVFACAAPDCGAPPEWAAGPTRPGIRLLGDLSEATADRLASSIAEARRGGDVVVLSIHWGGNWGWSIPRAHRDFAHRLIDLGVVDIVHGHSSHHPRPMEVYRGKLVLYGCGDFVNDYEGIGGYEAYRDDLRPAYLVAVDAGSGALLSCRIVVFQSRRLSLVAASKADAAWLGETLDREARRLGVRVELAEDGTLQVRWR